MVRLTPGAWEFAAVGDLYCFTQEGKEFVKFVYWSLKVLVRLQESQVFCYVKCQVRGRYAMFHCRLWKIIGNQGHRWRRRPLSRQLPSGTGTVNKWTAMKGVATIRISLLFCFPLFASVFMFTTHVRNYCIEPSYLPRLGCCNSFCAEDIRYIFSLHTDFHNLTQPGASFSTGRRYSQCYFELNTRACRHSYLEPYLVPHWLS